MSESVTHQPSALILGAGINGVAIARELLLNNLSVWLVNTADVASGTTAYSSRLIHGGLRYLEYGEFSLVKESLAERERLLRLAPHLVQPLRINIPVVNRAGGILQSLRRFLGGRISRPRPRGLWVVRLGLRFYDWFAKSGGLPRSRAHRASQASAVLGSRYRWFCSYSDAQVRFPERLVLSMLHDARSIAADRDLDFRLLTHAQVERGQGRFQISSGGQGNKVQPDVLVNATGPWGDRALDGIGIESPRLMGGTKGSHLISFCGELRQALDGFGIYAEAADGRPVFILPFGEATLIGTTDIPFKGDPREAAADEAEVDYLLQAVNQVLPQVRLQRADVEQHYCGVRPLPFTDASAPAATTRQHKVVAHGTVAPRSYTIVGGKLTTCRSLAEEVARRLLDDSGTGLIGTSADRPFPGAASDSSRQEWIAARQRDGWPGEQLQAAWDLLGSLVIEAVETCPLDQRGLAIAGTDLPRFLPAWCCRNEHARGLADLVERRLMLLFRPHLSRTTLLDLALILVDQDLLAAERVEAEVDDYCRRLLERFGKVVRP